MIETDVPDPWASKPEIRIDDGGGAGFKSGYDTANTLTINLPKNAGCWRINGNFHVYVTKRPNRLNHLMTKLLLGWEWMDT